MKTTRPYKPTIILKRIRKLFPNVNKVVDSKVDRYVSVTELDCSTAKKKDPANCAFANACTRMGIAEGAIITVSRSYLIKGNTATRYLTPESVAREIVSFDRHQDFRPGNNYKLSKVYKTNTMGAHKGGPGPKTSGPKKWKPGLIIRQHKTAGIRVTTSIN
jgi:hypothetical protein